MTELSDEVVGLLQKSLHELEQAQLEIDRLRETAEWLPNVQDEHCDQRIAYFIDDARAAIAAYEAKGDVVLDEG